MFKRLPNNFGTITKLNGNRRKPWRARKRVGEQYDDEKQTAYPIYTTVGYYETREDALRALAIYNGEIARDKELTLGDAYELWKMDYEQTKPMSVAYLSTWKNHLQPISKRKLADLKTIDLEAIVNSDRVPKQMRLNCAVILHGIFAYAMRHELISKDYSRIAKFNYKHTTEKKKTVFTAEEIERMWNTGTLWSKMTIVLLYTGMRISELIDMKTKDVHIDERYMVGGAKTEAGKNRIIPIHEDIVPIIREWLGGEYLCENKRKQTKKNTYRNNLSKLAPNHTPHDTRHTFITQAYRCGIPEQDIKRIVGHSLSGVTQNTYIHLSYEDLVAEMRKFHY